MNAIVEKKSGDDLTSVEVDGDPFSKNTKKIPNPGESPCEKDSLSRRETFSNMFFQEKAVFKILTVSLKDKVTREYGMVNINEDYEKKLYTHVYQPFLFVLELGLRLAYLYGCLNREFKKSHNKEYIFMWREIQSNDWIEWFKVKPYIENVRNEVSMIEYLI